MLNKIIKYKNIHHFESSLILKYINTSFNSTNVITVKGTAADDSE